MDKIYYARHLDNWTWHKSEEQPIIDYLFENGLIAVHFNGINSWAEKDYTTTQGRAAIRYLNENNVEPDGKCIFSAYQHSTGHRVLYGRAKKQGKFLLQEITRDDACPPIKVLRLESPKEVFSTDFAYPFLFPPKRATLVRWRQCERLANVFLGNLPLELYDAKSYLPSSLEILCEEFLREKGLIQAKLVETGGQLKDFDVIGMDYNGKTVYAQVKNISGAAQYDTFCKLAESNSKAVFYYFSSGGPRNSAPDNLMLINVEEVIRYLGSSKKYGESYLQRMASFRF